MKINLFIYVMVQKCFSFSREDINNSSYVFIRGNFSILYIHLIIHIQYNDVKILRSNIFYFICIIATRVSLTYHI